MLCEFIKETRKGKGQRERERERQTDREKPYKETVCTTYMYVIFPFGMYAIGNE